MIHNFFQINNGWQISKKNSTSLLDTGKHDGSHTSRQNRRIKREEVRRSAQSASYNFEKTGQIRKKPNEASEKKLGRFKPVFTLQQEKESTDFMLEMESRVFGLGTRDLRHLAYYFAERNNTPHATSGLAGRDWIYGFLSRNKNVSQRQRPELHRLTNPMLPHFLNF
ncbi:hypothetical protein ILUMI_07760 [Ignelater luminosus]|uniref:HTH CENPB-type domain-containing protein n=1 Tax=Ignelater luminosus TaxID=2038154 RepID=A0A8K0D863_IGNLU|nr:hypothetical protein ILUMI_07760 [Ignelater luminosus]